MTKASTILSNYESSRYFDITVENLSFKRRLVAYTASLVALLAVYCLTLRHIKNFSFHIAFFILNFILIAMIGGLVRRENLKIVKGIGAFHTKQSLLSRKSLFIPYENISNVIVNEVINFNRVCFVIQILCKKNLFAGNNSRDLNLIINGNFTYSMSK